jgi:Zn-dependent peptidase ImmA (M78 family)/DNA-binding transcriptional regulator YdaS (Cro superfamily)
LNPYLRVSGLDTTTCAKLLGYSPRLFHEWAVGQRPMPPSAAAHIASVLGVNADDLLKAPHQPVDVADIEPAVWFKLRSQNLGNPDRELVLLIRQLGTFYEELEQVRSEGSSGGELLLARIREKVNPQSSPTEQGRAAAQAFRRLTDLQWGKIGIGELLRRILRNHGILVVESPIRGSLIEGCAFLVGSSQRPCIFANIHNTTWFRRNAIILHELAHVVFDVASEGAALDVVRGESQAMTERRAEAFAEEAAIPREALHHIAQRNGVVWSDGLTSVQLATLVAELHVEAKLVLRAAVDYGFISAEQEESAGQLAIHEHLKKLSSHALSTAEYLADLEKRGESGEAWSVGKRSTTRFPRSLRLPVGYIVAVLQAFGDKLISSGRAARLLMIDEDTFAQRFQAPAGQ